MLRSLMRLSTSRRRRMPRFAVCDIRSYGRGMQSPRIRSNSRPSNGMRSREGVRPGVARQVYTVGVALRVRVHQRPINNNWDSGQGMAGL
jgi:hypothetical protein